jgi:hypothetical protein
MGHAKDRGASQVKGNDMDVGYAVPILAGMILAGLGFIAALGYAMLRVASQDDDRFDRDEQ